MYRLSSLLLFFAFLFAFNGQAQNAEKGITFFKGSFKDALVEAQKQNKPLFVDFYAVWCGPCKRMAKEVFTQDSVGAYFNANFISLQLDAEKGDNVALAKQYNVEAFPTLAFIAADGKAISVNTGAMNAAQLMEAGRIAAGESLRFEDLYEQYKKQPNDLSIQQALLMKAPAFLGAQEGMDAEKWAVRLRKLYAAYIKAKKGPALINKQDYLIINSVGGNDKNEIREMIDFINDNLPAWQAAIGNAAAYYVVENNDAQIEALAKAGDAHYKELVEKVGTTYQKSYAVVSTESISPAERTAIYADALYQLYKNKDTKTYIQAMSSLLQRLGKEATPADYGKAAQDLYYAAGNQLTADQHRQAIAWVEHALASEQVVMNRVNYLVMLGDSYRQLKDFGKAREQYNLANIESLRMAEMEMVQAMVQQTIARKLAELELLEK